MLSSDIRGGYSGTMQDLAGGSGSGAGIDDTTIDTNSTWSSDKITYTISSELGTYNSALRNGYSGTLKDLYDSIEEININSGAGTDDISKYPSVNPNLSRCLLTVSKAAGIVTSEYGYTLKGLHNVLNSGDWSAYIKDGDYIKFITDDDYEINMEFNIDPYYDANADGTTSKIAVHHIDMISRHLIPNFSYPMRTTNTNKGTAEQQNPYLASNGPGCMQAKLAEYYNYNIPDVLKAHIIKKKLVVPYRYGTGTLKSDNGSGLEELPELWVPFRKETDGTNAGSYETDMIRYTTLNSTTKRIKNTSSGSASYWWLASAGSGGSNGFSGVSASGSVGNAGANASDAYGVPLCFRFV